MSGEPLPDDLSAALRQARARLGPYAGRVHYVGKTASTNDVAAALASAGAPEGTTVVASCQTAGRGRLGRTWFSPPEAGLYVSVILRPEQTPSGLPPSRLPVLTLAAGVAVAEGVRTTTGLPAELKWPNDLVVGSSPAPAGQPAYRKLGGILTEAAALGSGGGWVVLGLGLNLYDVSWPPGLAAQATSIERELGHRIDRGLVLAEVLACVAARYDQLRRGALAALLARWVELSPMSHGTHVRWVDGGGERRGQTAGLDGTGALLVRTSGGLTRIVSGEVTWA